MSAGTSPLTPNPTQAYAPTPTTSARTSRNSSAPRRLRCTNCMRAPGWEERVVATSAPRRRGRGLVSRQALHGAFGVGEAVRADAVLDRVGRVGVELVDPHVAGLVGV